MPLQLYRYILTKSPLQLHLFSNLLFVHMTSNFGNLLFSKSFDDFGGGREGGGRSFCRLLSAPSTLSFDATNKKVKHKLLGVKL